MNNLGLMLLLVLMPAAVFSFDCPEPEGNFPNPDDCHKFFSCSNGVAHEMTCAANLFYDHQNDKCDHNPTVNCPVPSSAPDAFCYGLPNGDYQYENDCTKYITCSNNLQYIRDCPAGLHFSEFNGQKCLTPEEAQCQ